jgi:beta-lactamase regulating signal transducer with metallopeptidase domain
MIAFIIKATMLLGLAALADACLRRRGSASARHLSWTFAIVGLLLLPSLALVLPAWRISVPRVVPAAAVVDVESSIDRAAVPVDPIAAPAAGANEGAPYGDRYAAGRPADAASQSASSASRSPDMLVALYIAGLIALMIRMGLQRRAVRRLVQEADDVLDESWQRLLQECAAVMGVRRAVRLRRSRSATMPLATGTRHPAIVVPGIADTWSPDRQRAVLLHELAHLVRHDCLTQTLASLVCALYWFHPAAWWAARRLRIERELACDDRVLAAGAPARDYAGHLLEIAYAFDSHRAPALAVSMARPRQLEGRMLAVLDDARNRRVPAPRARLAAAGIAALLIVPLATATATVAAPESSEALALVETVPPAERATTAPHQVLQELTSTADRLRSAKRRLLREAAAAFGLRAPQGTGTWEIRPSRANDGTVHLRLTEGDSSWGRTVRLDTFEGLTASQLSAGGPVQFTLRRDAGTFTFKGVVQGGVGAGTFSFAPDPAFADGLAKRGFARPTASEQYALARADVGYAFIDELTKQGYAKPTTAELVRAGEHGVHTEYVREMGALGYRLETLAPLIELRDHGVGPDYIRALAEQGYKGLAADELRRARDHGVSADYVGAMKQAGYGSLTIAQLINARDHGVSADYVRALAEAGHAKVPLDQLVRARDHGVSGEYARDMRALGYQAPLDDLVKARDHGVSVEFVREIAAHGYKGQPIDALIRLRDHGVSSHYVQELKSLGYERLSIDDLVTLRDHGLSADRIRAANARAGTRLPVDMLKSLASGGMR